MSNRNQERERIERLKHYINQISIHTSSLKYDLINGKLPQAVEVFTGHKVGDMVELQGKEWKIEDIII